MTSPIEKYKADMASNKNLKKKNTKRTILSVLVAVMIISLIGVAYYFISAGGRLEREKLNVTVKTTSFYNELIRQINTNEDWVGFIDEFAIGAAKEDLSRDAVLLLDSANQGGQYLVRFTSPLQISIYDINKDKAEVLVDFELGERMVGDPERMVIVKKFITFEKTDSKWRITEIMDRSENFDNAIKK